jgi:hypothetical protein
MNKNCIISFANHKGAYVDRLARLSNSLRDNFDGDFLSWIGEESLGAEKHEENPYNFKVHAFRKAVERGYKKILWLDSSVFAVGNVQKIFDDIESTGFAFQDAGHYIGNYSTDKQLEYFGLTRDAAMEMKCIGNAGLLGLDFDKMMPSNFFSKWATAMEKGLFKGSWTNEGNTESLDDRCKGSRHDLSCSSIIVNQMGIFHLTYPGDEILQYGGIFSPNINSSIILKAQG